LTTSDGITGCALLTGTGKGLNDSATGGSEGTVCVVAVDPKSLL